MQRVDALLMQDWGGTESEHIAFRRPSMRAESKTASAAARHQERCGCAARANTPESLPFPVSRLACDLLVFDLWKPLFVYALMSAPRPRSIYVLSIMYSVHLIHGIPPMAQRPRGRRRLPPDAPNLASACDAVSVGHVDATLGRRASQISSQMLSAIAIPPPRCSSDVVDVGGRLSNLLRRAPTSPRCTTCSCERAFGRVPAPVCLRLRSTSGSS